MSSEQVTVGSPEAERRGPAGAELSPERFQAFEMFLKLLERSQPDHKGALRELVAAHPWLLTYEWSDPEEDDDGEPSQTALLRALSKWHDLAAVALLVECGASTKAAYHLQGEMRESGDLMFPVSDPDDEDDVDARAEAGAAYAAAVNLDAKFWAAVHAVLDNIHPESIIAFLAAHHGCSKRVLHEAVEQHPQLACSPRMVARELALAADDLCVEADRLVRAAGQPPLRRRSSSATSVDSAMSVDALGLSPLRGSGPQAAAAAADTLSSLEVLRRLASGEFAAFEAELKETSRGFCALRTNAAEAFLAAGGRKELAPASRPQAYRKLTAYGKKQALQPGWRVLKAPKEVIQPSSEAYKDFWLILYLATHAAAEESPQEVLILNFAADAMWGTMHSLVLPEGLAIIQRVAGQWNTPDALGKYRASHQSHKPDDPAKFTLRLVSGLLRYDTGEAVPEPGTAAGDAQIELREAGHALLFSTDASDKTAQAAATHRHEKAIAAYRMAFRTQA